MATAHIGGIVEWGLGVLLIAFAVSVLQARRPIHASLAFLGTLMVLAVLYLNLAAEFIAVMQVLIYAGAILVLFVFVMMLFQGSLQQPEEGESEELPERQWWLFAAVAFTVVFLVIIAGLMHGLPIVSKSNKTWASVEELGKTLCLECFFPFEVTIFLFLVAVVGALYTAKKGE